jgi:hypothetical protein
MKRFNSAMIAAALVCAAFGVGACAADNLARSTEADKTQVKPSKMEAQQAQPSNETMDANAQRAHDRNTGSTTSRTTTQRPQVATGEVRNWDAIDKNNDNLISPEEMEAELQQKGASKGMTKQ